VNRVTISAAALALGIGLAGLNVSPAFAAQTATAQTAAAQTTRVRPADNWFDGGRYPTFADCSASGQEALRGGFGQYQCAEVYAPDGAIAYWQLWIAYL
jgi:hypothetical protein